MDAEEKTYRRKIEGTILTLISLVFFAFAPVMSKLGLSYYDLQTTLFFWFFSAAVFSFLIVLFTGKLKLFFRAVSHKKFIVIFTLFNVFSISSYFGMVKTVGPALTSFLTVFSIPISVLFGVFFLKEKLKINEILGLLISFAGLLIIVFSTGNLIIGGLIFAVIHWIMFSASKAYAKHHIVTHDPIVMTSVRAFFAFFAFALVFLVTGDLSSVDYSNIWVITVPPILSAVIGHIILYYAYTKFEMSKSTILKPIEPVFVLILSFFVLGMIPSYKELIGGLIILIGVIVFVYRKKNNYS